jgi:3-mercaptopyruvate sulfurtransferase SseA
MNMIALRERPQVEFEANGHKYDYVNYLDGGIYAWWKKIVKLVVKPKGKKQTQFYNAQAVVEFSMPNLLS